MVFEKKYQQHLKESLKSKRQYEKLKQGIKEEEIKINE